MFGLGGLCDLCGASARGLCSRCREDLPAPPAIDLWPDLDAVHAVIAYEGRGSALLRGAKFSNRRSSLDVLADSAVPFLGHAIGTVVPVPADATRRRRRGYDLPELLADIVGKRLGVASTRALGRTGHETQQGLPRRDRLHRGGFRATRSVAGTVLLVDDVVTTGATARACAALLRAGGADAVDLFVIAATPPPKSDSQGPVD
ncbi:MAG: ComF family protein [Acidimicrobiales bacterium]